MKHWEHIKPPLPIIAHEKAERAMIAAVKERADRVANSPETKARIAAENEKAAGIRLNQARKYLVRLVCEISRWR
jgi:hypothetical protein